MCQIIHTKNIGSEKQFFLNFDVYKMLKTTFLGNGVACKTKKMSDRKLDFLLEFDVGRI